MTGSIVALSRTMNLTAVCSPSQSEPSYSVRAVHFSANCSILPKGRLVSRPRVRLSGTFSSPSTKSTFFHGGVTLRKAAVSQHGSTRRRRALIVQMSIFDRIVRLVKSYANAIISTVEDPEKILDQTVEEMNTDLTKMRQASAQVLASQKICEGTDLAYIFRAMFISREQ